MAASPELIDHYWEELRACLRGEVAMWSAMSLSDIRARLQGRANNYDVAFCGNAYGVVAELLDERDSHLTLMLEVQPASADRISIMADPRPLGSGGWTDREMAIASEIFDIQECTLGRA